MRIPFRGRSGRCTSSAALSVTCCAVALSATCGDTAQDQVVPTSAEGGITAVGSACDAAAWSDQQRRAYFRPDNEQPSGPLGPRSFDEQCNRRIDQACETACDCRFAVWIEAYPIAVSVRENRYSYWPAARDRATGECYEYAFAVDYRSRNVHDAVMYDLTCEAGTCGMRPRDRTVRVPEGCTWQEGHDSRTCDRGEHPQVCPDDLPLHVTCDVTTGEFLCCP